MIGLGLSLAPGATGSLGASAGPAPPITGGRMALAGDSFAANNLSAPGANSFTTYQSGFEVMLECLSGGKFQFVPGLQKGVAGRRSDEVLSAFAAEIAPGAALFDLGTVNVGRNDVTQTGLLTTAQSVANIKAICQAFLDIGKPVLLWLPNPPRSDGTLDTNSATRAAQRLMMADVNGAMRGWSKAGVHLVDFEAAWNAGGGVPNGNVTYDGLHPSRLGAYHAAKAALDAHGALFPDRTPPLYTNYNASTNPFGNLISIVGATVPTLAGTAGQRFNCQGSLATGYVFGRNSGSNADAEIQLAKEAVGDGTFRQIVDFGPAPATMAGSFTGEVLGTGASFGSRPAIPAELVGRQVVFEVTMEVVSSAGFGLPLIQMTAWNNNVSVTSNGLSQLDGMAADILTLPAGSYLLKTPSVTISAVDAAAAFWGNLIMAILGGSQGRVKLTKPSINRVT